MSNPFSLMFGKVPLENISLPLQKNQISEDEVICSIVYEFASKLPYSMDYMDKDFVPGIFLNVAPNTEVIK